MIIDEQSVLSAYDDKCTLLQAINKMNENVNSLGDKIISNDMIFAGQFNPNETEPYSTGTYKENSLYVDYSKGILYQYQRQTGGSKPYLWEPIFKFAKAE